MKLQLRGFKTRLSWGGAAATSHCRAEYKNVPRHCREWQGSCPVGSSAAKEQAHRAWHHTQLSFPGTFCWCCYGKCLISWFSEPERYVVNFRIVNSSCTSFFFYVIKWLSLLAVLSHWQWLNGGWWQCVSLYFGKEHKYRLIKGAAALSVLREKVWQQGWKSSGLSLNE